MHEAAAEPDRALQGRVARVTYHAPDGLYTVLRIEAERGHGDPEGVAGELVTAVGRTEEPSEGLRVRLTGRWSEHKLHGRQFAFDALEVLPPADAEGLVRYLASKTFEGIGETLARRIVDKLGPRALARVLEDPGCLAGIQGLRPAVRARFAERVRAELGAHELRAFLLGVGLGPVQAQAAAKAVGPAGEERVRADPYVLAGAVEGIGFQTADRVARHLGFALDSDERLRAGLVHALESAAGDGHTLLPRARLVRAAAELLGEGTRDEALEPAVDELARRGTVTLETGLRELPSGAPEPLVYLPALATCERRLAENLLALADSGPVPPLADARALAAAEAETGLELHEKQREAVLGLLSAPLALLTGGPGVGKTTIVRLVVELAERARRTVLLASPTGRAAKRLAEATGRPASTVHRLLGYEPRTRGFAHGTDNALVADLVVIDEMSMMDVVLAHHLLKAIAPPTRLVLVGDPDQLPSVAAGNVLADLLRCERVPLWRLRQVFRQDEKSRIVHNAHKILHGEWPELPRAGEPLSDFYLFPVEDPIACAERVVDVVSSRIPRRYGMDWVRDVQVLAPMYRGPCGVDALNERLRAALGQGGHELRRGERTWRTGDRVIHTRNDYEREIYNGDMGRIVRVHQDGSGLVVRFPEQEVAYSPEQLGDLQSAFAITVHRAQGGEFPCVVLPLVTQHYLMLQRHLLYTAVTRAKQLVVLVGSPRALQMALDNAEQKGRESALCERLRAGLPR